MRSLPYWILLVAASPLVAEEAPPPRARLVHEWEMGSSPVKAVRFAEDGTSMALDLTGGAARLGDDVQALPRAAWRGLICAAIPAPPGPAFVGLSNGNVGTWELSTGERRLTSTRHGSTVACAVVSPDGTLVATGS